MNRILALLTRPNVAPPVAPLYQDAPQTEVVSDAGRWLAICAARKPGPLWRDVWCRMMMDDAAVGTLIGAVSHMWIFADGSRLLSNDAADRVLEAATASQINV